MNYRHAFHAGNFADVHKHLVLLALLERLQRKPKPLFYMDTHAGRGWYGLQTRDAQRGGEWRDGIARLLAAQAVSEDLRRYRLAVSSAQERSQATTAPVRYPGSPILAMEHLREGGHRVVLVERQIEEAHALDQAAHGRRGVSIVCGDGYAALRTYLPPRENRGLVLIDPPYESDQEFAQVQRALQLGMARWPNGMYALWYPIKAGPNAQRLQTALQQSGLRKLLLLELMVRPSDSPLGLNGSGLIVANPPWQFDVEIAPALEELSAALAARGAARPRVHWLVPE